MVVILPIFGFPTPCGCIVADVSNVLDLASDLKAIASLSTQPHRLGRTLGNALHSLGQVIPFDLAVLYRLDGQTLVPAATDGPLASDAIRAHRLRLDEFPTLVRVLDHGRPMALHEEHHASDEGDPYDSVLDLPHGHACMVIPLLTGDAAVGLITLDRKVLADIAMHEGEAFKGIIAQAKKALADKPAAA